MKLRALSLTNVRKFTGKRAVIENISDGITVVSEANEFGKSTFFDAIHALFFEKYGSTARPVKSLQPYAGGGVEVAAEIETDAGRFLVEKRFLSKKMARIVRLSDRVTIAQDDEAERWISDMLGAGDGPAGLLWVRQGLVGLVPETAKDQKLQTETRRDLLSTVAGEIDAMTGGRRMDRVMRRLAEDLLPIATKTGKKTGVWKAASDDVATLEAEHAALVAKVQDLLSALSQRDADESTLSRLDQPEAKTRRELALAEAQIARDTARAHAGHIAAARQDRDIARLKADLAKSDLQKFLSALLALSAAADALQTAASKAELTEQVAAERGQACNIARQKQDATLMAEKHARARLDAAHQQGDARKAQAEALRLADLIGKAEAAQAEFDAASARVATSRATPDWLEEVEAVATTVARLEAVMAAQSTTLRFDYRGALRASMDGRMLDHGQAVPLQGQVTIDLPGLGSLTIHAQSQGDSGIDALAKARAKRDALCAIVGADAVPAARRLAADRVAAVQEAGLAKAVLATLAPDGIAALRSAKAVADLAARLVTEVELPALAELQADFATAETRNTQAVEALRVLERDHLQAREVSLHARAAADNARALLDRSLDAAGPADQHDAHRATLLFSEARAAEVLDLAQAHLETLTAAAPDLATTEAAFTRAEAATAAAASQRSQLETRLAGLSAKIETLAGNGIEQRLAEVAGQLDAARGTEARLSRRAAALTRLQAALEAERAAAQETYFGPVQRALKPLLAILHRDAALSFDRDSLLPMGLTRGQTAEALDDLSGGTREQIAILTRLAFARLFAAQGRHLPIVLDDALVYSDDDRIIKMFTALTREAQDQQIIVFSCRQLAFQDLGGARPLVQISEA